MHERCFVGFFLETVIDITDLKTTNNCRKFLSELVNSRRENFLSMLSNTRKGWREMIRVLLRHSYLRLWPKILFTGNYYILLGLIYMLIRQTFGVRIQRIGTKTETYSIPKIIAPY
jgi:hypothetical protein